MSKEYKEALLQSVIVKLHWIVGEIEDACGIDITTEQKYVMFLEYLESLKSTPPATSTEGGNSKKQR